MAGQASKINGKKGGRPKGKKNAATIEKEAALAVFRRKVERAADKLFRVQMSAAEGVFRMVVIVKDEAGVPHAETVRDEKRMDKLLETGIPGKDYFILAGKASDWRAADAMLDRSFGKAVNTTEIKDPDGALKNITIVKNG